MSLFDTGIRPAVDAWLLNKSKEVRDYGDYWSASSAGYCMRRVIFERLGVPKIESAADARKQRVFTSGHLFHDWLQGITKEAGLSIAQELELQDEELLIRGHIDDLILVGAPIYEGTADPLVVVPAKDWPPKHLILYDYKTVNSRAFMWAKKNGGAMSHYHRLQLGTYMYMLRKASPQSLYMREVKNKYPDVKLGVPKEYDLLKDLTESRILKIEKDTLMMMEQQLIWSPQLESEVFNYWNELNAYWKNKTMPRCSCGDYEGGFLAKPDYNGYYFEGESCSLKWYEKCKKEGLLK